MKLAEVLREECISVEESASGKKDVLHRIASLAGRCSILENIEQEQIASALHAREDIGTTGFGNEIAIPHCALDGVDDFVVGIVIYRKGAPFASLDEKPVKLVVFIIGPKQNRNEHIHLLSAISRVLNNPDAIREILNSAASESVKEVFLRHTIDEIEPDRAAEKSLFHVFIQDEEKLDQVLAVFSGIEGCNISIIEGRDAGYYLHKLPLFSGFLVDKKKGVHQIVFATVQKSLANEMLRRLANIAGNLANAEGILVIVQDIAFCAGTLNY